MDLAKQGRFPTIMRLASLSLPAGRMYDGIDVTSLLQATSSTPAPRPGGWFFYFTSCSPTNGCPPTRLTDKLPSDRIIAVRQRNGPLKVHFLTHGGEAAPGAYVLHQPPLVFDVEQDPGEMSPLQRHSFVGNGCSGNSCFDQFIEEARRAVAAHSSSISWCEHCGVEGVHGRSMLSAPNAISSSVMDCRGLSAEEGQCCMGAGRCRHPLGDYSTHLTRAGCAPTAQASLMRGDAPRC